MPTAPAPAGKVAITRSLAMSTTDTALSPGAVTNTLPTRPTATTPAGDLATGMVVRTCCVARSTTDRLWSPWLVM